MQMLTVTNELILCTLFRSNLDLQARSMAQAFRIPVFDHGPVYVRFVADNVAQKHFPQCSILVFIIINKTARDKGTNDGILEIFHQTVKH
jgi:hypothetical protein